MLRSMFSGVSGLRAHQTMMDVTGNNIANVNTTGFKSSRATFSDALNQVVRGGTQAREAAGGVNPMQLGLGARVAGIQGVFEQGGTQVTGRPSDLSIQGEGYFTVQQDGANYYTRAGAFSFDAPGAIPGQPNASSIVTPTGGRLMGWAPGAAQTPENLEALTVDLAQFSEINFGNDGQITGRNAAGELTPLGTVAVADFANSDGLQRIGNSVFAEGGNSGEPLYGAAGADGRGAIEAGTLEMSNVDLAQEFTSLILAQRGFQANARTITTTDEMLSDLVNLKR